MKFFFVVIVLLLHLSCTTLSPQTKSLLNDSNQFKKSQINEVPFIAQSDGDCGPTALTMALKNIEVTISVDQVSPLVFTPDKNGSLPTNMIGAARTLNMLAIEVNDMKSLVAELNAGHPVVILQNLGFSFLPNWHYAVVVGYDLEDQVFYLHSGTKKSTPMPMTYFERHWQLADHWAIVVLKPGELSASGDELSHMKAASGLEAMGRLDEAYLSYQSLLKKWPNSLAIHVGLANVAYQKKNFKASKAYLKKALEFHPDSSVLHNNLKVIDEALLNSSRKNKKR